MVTQTKTLGSSLISSFSFPTSIHCISMFCQLYLQNISIIQTLLITRKQPLWTNPQSSPLPILQLSGNCLTSTSLSLQHILKPHQHCSDPSSVFSLHMITSPNLVRSYLIHPLTSLSSSPPTPLLRLLQATRTSFLSFEWTSILPPQDFGTDVSPVFSPLLSGMILIHLSPPSAL